MMKEECVFDDTQSTLCYGTEEVLKRFIQAYECLPELWDRENPLYKNKLWRKSALEQLLTIYQKLKPKADTDDVLKKINTLRSNYRRELNKINASRSLGEEPMYRPSSWVFYALKFLHDVVKRPATDEQEDFNPHNLYTTDNRETNDNQNSQSVEENSVSKSWSTAFHSYALHPSEAQDDTDSQSATPSVSTIVISPPPAKRSKLLDLLSKEKEPPNVADDYVAADCNRSTAEDDELYLNIGKVWATKLKSLQPIQRKLAEKAINDILFVADMGNLHINSVEINRSKVDGPSRMPD